MGAIGKGDWVECLGIERTDFSWDMTSGEEPVRGRIYRVDKAGSAIGTDGVLRDAITLVSPKARSVRGREIAWKVSNFRPIYRPNADFIDSLKQPSPARELEEV